MDIDITRYIIAMILWIITEQFGRILKDTINKILDCRIIPMPTRYKNMLIGRTAQVCLSLYATMLVVVVSPINMIQDVLCVYTILMCIAEIIYHKK